MEGLWNYINYDSSGIYMYGVLAGGVLGVGLLVCGVVSAAYTTLMCVMYHIIYSFSSDFVSNLKMAIRAETCR